MNLQRVVPLVLVGMSILVLQAQSPVFEVASIKANHSGTDVAGMRASRGSLSIVNAPLRKIVATSFGISEDRDESLIDGPDWLRTERYDIAATFAEETQPNEMRLMLQALLRERFQMCFHRETRKVPAYTLVVNKSGLKAKLAAPGAVPGFQRTAGHLASASATMSQLADKLAQQSDRPVVDYTGIQGSYALTLSWERDELGANRGLGVSLYTAIQEQLGLRLEARNEPMDVIVIEYLERQPTSN